MNARIFSQLKPIVGLVVLLGVLGAGVLSLQTMNHGAAAHQGCLGLSIGTPPCVGLADVTSCLLVHLGVLQAISQAVPPLSQLLVILIVAVALWFVVKRKRGELNVLAGLRLRLQRFNASPNVLLKKIGQWLILHEKRDPAPVTPVVFGVLALPAM